MEDAYIEENNKSHKRIFLLVLIGVLIIFLIIIASSYAFFRINSVDEHTTTRGTISLDCIDIQYEEVGKIDLPDAYPVTDAYGKVHSTPVTVKITNKCETNLEKLNYALVLTTLTNGDNIPSSKIRVYSKRGIKTTELSEFLEPTYLDELPELSNEYSTDALNKDIQARDGFAGYAIDDSRVIDENFLDNSATNTYELRIWIDYYEGDKGAYTSKNHDPSYDNSTANQSYIGALSVVANPYEQYSEPPKADADAADDNDINEVVSSDLSE